MYLRHSTITKNGKAHTYWRLVRAVRVGSKVRQETVAQLGELDAKGRIAAKHLADSLIELGSGRRGFFDDEVPTELRYGRSQPAAVGTGATVRRRLARVQALAGGRT